MHFKWLSKSFFLVTWAPPHLIEPIQPGLLGLLPSLLGVWLSLAINILKLMFIQHPLFLWLVIGELWSKHCFNLILKSCVSKIQKQNVNHNFDHCFEIFDFLWGTDAFTYQVQRPCGNIVVVEINSISSWKMQRDSSFAKPLRVSMIFQITLVEMGLTDKDFSITLNIKNFNRFFTDIENHQVRVGCGVMSAKVATSIVLRHLKE